MPGRKPVPIAVHKLKGSYQKVRHEAASRLEAGFGAPCRPEGLSDAADLAWDALAPLLVERRILTAADGWALQVLCETYAEWQELSHDVRAEGRVYELKTESGAIMRRPNPKCAMLSDCQRRLNAAFTGFGIEPSSRTKVAPLSDSGLHENPFAKLGSTS